MDTARVRRPARSAIQLAFMLLATAWHCAAAGASCETAVADRPKVGLVLGGGGARGIAHIGVIKVLEEMRVPVDYVGGTSFGSLVGGLLATGMTADQLEAIVLGVDWNDAFSDETARQDQPFRRKRDDNLAMFGPKIGVGKGSSLVPRGPISGQKISFLLERLIHDRAQVDDFDDLVIPFRAVAADIVTGEQVVLEAGDLAQAMRSSMSVPGLFDPVVWGDHLLVDGAIVNNLPVDVVRSLGADVVVVVDVGTALSEKKELDNVLAIISQLSGLMVKSNTSRQLASLNDDDVLIVPALGDLVSASDFDKSEQSIAIGYMAADAARSRLANLALPEADYAAYRAARAACVTPLPPVQFVRLENTSRFDDSVIRERLNVREGEPLDIDALDDDIRQIHALGFLKLVQYRVVEQDGQSGIVIRVEQDSRGTDFLEWGLDLFGDGEHSAANLRLGYLNSAVDRFGSELRTVLQVGEDPALYADFYKYLDPRLKTFLPVNLFAERRDVPIYEDGDLARVARVSQYGGALGLGREFGRAGALSFGVRLFDGEVEQEIGTGPMEALDYDGGEYYLRGMYDRLDDRYFPSYGALVDLQFLKSDESLGADEEYDQVLVDALIARSSGRHTLMAGARYYETLDGLAPVYSVFRVGGFVHLSGYNEGELSGQNFAMGMAGYRFQAAGSGLLPAYVGTTLEYGQVADDVGAVLDDGIFNGSVYLGYRSPIGPLYLGMGMAEGGRQRYFMRIGNVFGNTTIGR